MMPIFKSMAKGQGMSHRQAKTKPYETKSGDAPLRKPADIEIQPGTHIA
jgi:hypothetical protein